MLSLRDYLSLREHMVMSSQCSRGREEREETWRLYFYPVWLGCGRSW